MNEKEQASLRGDEAQIYHRRFDEATMDELVGLFDQFGENGPARYYILLAGRLDMMDLAKASELAESLGDAEITVETAYDEDASLKDITIWRTAV